MSVLAINYGIHEVYDLVQSAAACDGHLESPSRTVDCKFLETDRINRREEREERDERED